MSVRPLLADLRFEHPWALLLGAAAVLVLVLSLRRERRPGGGLLFSSLGLLPRSRTTWRAQQRWALVLLRLCATLLLTLALARPQVAQASFEVVAEGIDIALALDVSSSMSTRDFGGGRSRIDAAKRVVHDFLEGLKNDRVGVVLFADEALVLSPLTLDYRASQRAVEPIVPGKLLRDGTAIGTGLASALNVLRDSQAKSKAVILLTDGENNSGQIGPLDAAQMGKLLGIRVYTVGAVGASNEVDERLMRRISETTGGQYYRASDESTLLEIYREIARLEKSRLGARKNATYDDAYLPFLVPAAALLLLEVLLAGTLFRRAP